MTDDEQDEAVLNQVRKLFENIPTSYLGMANQHAEAASAVMISSGELAKKAIESRGGKDSTARYPISAEVGHAMLAALHISLLETNCLLRELISRTPPQSGVVAVNP